MGHLWSFVKIKKFTYPYNKVTISFTIKNNWASGPDVLVLIYKKRVLVLPRDMSCLWFNLTFLDHRHRQCNSCFDIVVNRLFWTNKPSIKDIINCFLYNNHVSPTQHLCSYFVGSDLKLLLITRLSFRFDQYGLTYIHALLL